MSTTRKPSQQNRYALADVIRHGREACHLTQEQLAAIMGCTRRWIQALELGKGNPNWRDMVILATALQIDLVELAREVGFDVPVYSR